METYHEKLDVLMDDESGTICQVAEEIVPEEGVEIVDVTGKLLFPGIHRRPHPF